MTSTIGSVLSALTSSSATSTSTSSTIDESEFLELLVAQMQNQDPLNPMSDTDYTAVLAQFSSLSLLTSLSTKIDSIAEDIEATNISQAASLVGSNITAEGSVVKADGSSSDIIYDLSDDIASGTINIYNSSGTLTDSIDLSAQTSGQHTVTWDCSDVTSGNYTVEISAYDSSGTAVTVSTYTSGTATGVTVEDGTLCFIVNGQNVPYENVVSIEQAS
jgi:flagellar basal-body rod modification protein FlgD